MGLTSGGFLRFSFTCSNLEAVWVTEGRNEGNLESNTTREREGGGAKIGILSYKSNKNLEDAASEEAKIQKGTMTIAATNREEAR